jgi:hypothetical protein
MVARLGYRAAVRIENATFRISFYWPSGYLCAQLTNESSGENLAVEAGSSVIEFQCPTLPIVSGLYRVDVAIETNGQELDLRQRAATLVVEAGIPAMGDFYIENAWSVRRNSPPVN